MERLPSKRVFPELSLMQRSVVLSPLLLARVKRYRRSTEQPVLRLQACPEQKLLLELASLNLDMTSCRMQQEWQHVRGANI